MQAQGCTDFDRVDRNFHLRDLVYTPLGKTIERVGRDAAKRYHQDPEDGAQEAWAIACEHWERGYPPSELLRLVKRDLDSRWSQLRHLTQDDPRSPRSEGSASGASRRSYGVPITGLDRLLARLTASTLGPGLDRLSVHADLRCPECGRAGHWEAAPPRGTKEARRRARAWHLAAQADAAYLEAGTPTGGGPRAEDQHAAAGVAGTEPVWVCGHPGGLRKHWTRMPVARLREGGDPSGGMHVSMEFGDTGRVERAFVGLMDVLAMERRRRPSFEVDEVPRLRRRRGRPMLSAAACWEPMTGPSWTPDAPNTESTAAEAARPLP